MSGIQDYDYLVLLPRITLSGGVGMAIILSFYVSAPASLRITVFVVGITCALFNFSIALIPWWLFVKQIISIPHRSRRQISIVQWILTLLMGGAFIILAFWLLPALYTTVTQLRNGMIRLEVPSLLPLSIVLLVNLVGILSIYSYVKIRRRF